MYNILYILIDMALILWLARILKLLCAVNGE